MTTPPPPRGPPRRNPRPLLAALVVLLALALALWALCLRTPAGTGGNGGAGTGDGGGAGTGDGAGSGELPGGGGAAPAATTAQPAGAAPATPALESAAAAVPEPAPRPGPALDGIRLTADAGQESEAADAGAAAGGKGGHGLGTGDLSFRLYWKPPREDLDLHVVDPKGHRLSHLSQTCPCSGKMDRDDTVEGGPENIFWPRGAAPKGTYSIRVEYYAGTGAELFTVEARLKGLVTETFTGTLQNKGDQSQEFTVSY